VPVPVRTLVARTYLRYVIPVTVLSWLAFTPLLYLALRVPVPADALQAKGVLRTAWLLVGMSLLPLLVLVGGVSPAVRSIAAGQPASQLAALGTGVVGLLRAIIPCLVALLAVAISSLALAIPGLVMLVLLSLTGAHATEARGLPAPLTESVASARAHLRTVALVLLVTIGAVIGGVYALEMRGIVLPLPKQPTPELFANFRLFARYAISALAILAPIPAIALAALAATAGPSARS
jgi:hypothetical protein